ncbi:LAME_0G11606g1_1 [Lachancea meyersii CBS 8951]|uniref:LAME_0G11606g1_1 n=1 Tax=Lachancea meyersii CBS 8951 TaxID=1266667 RepID=A0A1G4K9F6_9SACH|nr:LAME_0G11606g1_1 [Lachancea meyersii CBS 8951]
MDSEPNQTSWTREADKLLKFRDQKVSELDEEDLTLKRLIIERRIRKAAKEHIQDETAFHRGRIDLVSAGYLTAMCMDYGELKTAGVAYKAESETTNQVVVDAEHISDGDKYDSPERQDATMELLVSKELNNDRGSNAVYHVSKEQRLLASARKNAELVKSMLNESCIESSRQDLIQDPEEKGTTNASYASPDSLSHKKYNNNANQASHNDLNATHSSTASASTEPYNHYDNLILNNNDVMKPYQPLLPFDLAHSNPAILHSTLPIKTSTGGIKKTRSGTLSPRTSQPNPPPQRGSRSKTPKALRKMEDVARKHSL